MKLIAKMAAVGAAATLGLALLAVTPANAAEPSGPVNGAPSSLSVAPSGAIAIPMVAVPHANGSSRVHTNVVIDGNCGTAFLYPSNGGDHIHYDFGYEYLNNATFWVTAHVGTQNSDTGEADVNSFNRASFGSSWERQGNLYTGTDMNYVSAYITAYGPLYDCVSSPLLEQDVYVY